MFKTTGRVISVQLQAPTYPWSQIQPSSNLNRTTSLTALARLTIFLPTLTRSRTICTPTKRTWSLVQNTRPNEAPFQSSSTSTLSPAFHQHQHQHYFSTLLSRSSSTSQSKMVANLNLNGHSASFHSSPPPLPPGKSKHHIVMLESIHCAPPTFDFPHTMDTHLRTTPAQVAERIRDATIVIACVVPVTPADMDQAPHLDILAVMAVGIGWVDKADCARRGVTVTNCIAGNVDAVSEHFLGLYFAARKNLVRAHRAVTQTHDWKEKGTLTKTLFSSDTSPKNQTENQNQDQDQDQVSARGGGGASGPPMGCGQEVLGIMGYGALGKRIEKLAKAVGFGEVLISERKHGHGHKDIRQGRTPFTETLRRATTICICLPKEPDTVDLIAEKELRQMRPDACLINLARGGIVNEAALAKALREHWIACAATDVLEVEPAFPGSSPLVPEEGGEEVPNLTISPHIAWYTQSTIENYKRLLKQGIEGWVAGTLQHGPDKVDEVVVVHGGKVWR